MFHHEYFKSTNEFQQKMTAWLHEKKIPENSRFYRMVEALFDIQNSQHNGINENNDVRKTELMLEF